MLVGIEREAHFVVGRVVPARAVGAGEAARRTGGAGEARRLIRPGDVDALVAAAKDAQAIVAEEAMRGGPERGRPLVQARLRRAIPVAADEAHGPGAAHARVEVARHGRERAALAVADDDDALTTVGLGARAEGGDGALGVPRGREHAARFVPAVLVAHFLDR